MFDFLFNPQGRISRKGWWLGFTLPYLALTIIGSVLGPMNVIFGLTNTLIGLFFLWPSLVAVPVKRFHDLGMTGFWQLGFVVAEFVLVVTLFVGIGMYAFEAGLEEEMAGMGTMSAADQIAIMAEYVGPALTHPVSLVSLILLLAANLAWLFLQGVKRGQAGPNTHGEDPLASGRGFAD